MNFDFSEMNAEQLEARKAELLEGMDNPEKRDALIHSFPSRRSSDSS